MTASYEDMLKKIENLNTAVYAAFVEAAKASKAARKVEDMRRVKDLAKITTLLEDIINNHIPNIGAYHVLQHSSSVLGAIAKDMVIDN